MTKKMRRWALSLAFLPVWTITHLVLPIAPVRADDLGVDAIESLLPFRYAWVKSDGTPVYAASGDPAQMAPTRTLSSNMWVSIADELQVDGYVWYRIGEGEYVRSGDLWLAKPSPFHGVLVGDAEPSPFGFVVGQDLNVRARPGAATDNPPLAQLQRYTVVSILGREAATDGVWYRIGPDRYVHSAHVGVVTATPRPDGVAGDEKWIAVNLSEQTLAAYEGERMVYATLVSTGLPWWGTPEGLFRIQRKLRFGDMSGRSDEGEYYYLVQDVPWAMYFHGAYALHATYWHDGFGQPRSRGCVNLSPRDAWWLFGWTTPSLPEGSRTVHSREGRPGTWVYLYSAPAELALE